MSDGHYQVHVHGNVAILELSREDFSWATEVLPDDDLEIPPEHIPSIDEFETVPNETEKWTDVDFEEFKKEIVRAGPP
ncbi:uncharacterized protein SPPG_03650 [Spizellomyces punctatus DAOM BR117]|uniref:Anaphase-promoting complex subunit 13 n=1 Tax=Spizellomyces punctatus (strain DAOM BR117) TaxID=645134 RepID=A0A0L0HLS6_SPIPD|nr:uncharacterized protein SPPG_03650 [Spizellomyces punctatus DAOM BR117]KND01860.1 hypothetical protein SPPG_03650 [Spizellomyces punctatus DAOM BR117]|eukprot:XP_016609899.1 hypothetical protein SPPG_03650 [Spizellomyces punctatus DAOM BR117]